MHWLLTRPAGHNAALARTLTARGHRVTVQSALVIRPLAGAAESPAWTRLDAFAALIFTSINAVDEFAAQLAARRLSWPAALCLAIGTATAQALAARGHRAISPDHAYTTESLLALPLWPRLAGRTLLLVSGRGGRGVLAPALAECGVTVARLDVYERVCNPVFEWPALPVDGIFVTSVESWRCVLDHAPEAAARCVVVAGSARIAQVVASVAARTLVAASPRDDDMLAAFEEAFP